MSLSTEDGGVVYMGIRHKTYPGVIRVRDKTNVVKKEHDVRHSKLNKGRIPTNFLVPGWDLDGIPEDMKHHIDSGYAHYTWTPFPIGLKVAELILHNLYFIETPLFGKTVEDIKASARILHATAGAGGSTVALSQVFSNVSAGDFCERQLKVRPLISPPCVCFND